MKICMVTGESRPLCKTGGLADVCYSLSKELVSMGEEVSIILPFYTQIKQKHHLDYKHVIDLPIHMSWRVNLASVYQVTLEGINYFLIDSPQYFERKGLYGEDDDMERFAFFTLAAKQFLAATNYVPDIIHIHDWHPGMLPCLIKEDSSISKTYENTKFVTSIHNPAFQGMMDKYFLGNYYNLSDDLYYSGQVRFKDQVSTLKTAIVYSDKITTVSPTHREELLNPETGMGLDSILRLREYDFVGILNGIDYEEFNPVRDANLIAPYHSNTFLRNKVINKRALFDEFGVVDYGGPTFSLVSRVTWQKGMDLVFDACEALLAKGANIILLGSGEHQYEERMQMLKNRFPKNVLVYIGYNDALAHKVYASSDFFMMPSLFEPCGLGQMIAQRYGTLPIVRRTGGLKDSVINYDTTNLETSNGFGFDAFSSEEMVRTCLWAYDLWFDLPLRKRLMKNAMKTDNTWKQSALKYLSVYKSIKQ